MNPSTSLPPVRSVQELVSLARARETHAAARYRELAGRLRQRRELGLALLFDWLATTEEGHAAQVEQWAPNADGPSPDGIEGFDPAAADSRLLTAYEALAQAVRAETRAFVFYTYLAAEAPDAAVRRMAETLAKEELAHAALLRRERRKAYRKDRAKASSPMVNRRPSLDELWRLTWEAESRAAGYHRALAGGLAGRADVAAVFARIAEDEADCAREAETAIGGRLPKARRQPPPTLDGGLKVLEAGFERYARIVEEAVDETVMLTAQELAQRALGRLHAAHLALRGAHIKAAPQS